MANFYLDISAIGNEYQAYADSVATWGVPQDGNGKAGPGGSPAVAIATIDCATATCAGAGSISLLGVTVSSTLTGTGSALATAIAAAINASATALTATYSAALLPLNKLVFARTHPTTTTLVQIMLRVAGTDWNAMAPTYGGTWSVNPTMGAFSGGADGPFAYLVNGSTIFGKTIGTGGIWAAKSMAVANPTETDPIYVRTMRSGANLTATISNAAAGISAQCTGLGRCLIADNGTTWSGDNGQFTLDLSCTFSGGQVHFTTYNGGIVFIGARAQYGFRIRVKTNAAFAAIGADGNAGLQAQAYYFNILVEQVDAQGGATLQLGNRVATNGWFGFESSKVIYKSNQTVIVSINSGYGYWASFKNSLFEWQGIGADVSTLIAVGSDTFANNGGGEIAFVGCEFIVDAGVYKIASFMTGAENITSACLGKFSVENCKGLWNPSMGVSASTARPQKPVFYWRDRETGSFRLESWATTSDYVSTNAYPSLNAATPQGAAMTYRFSWETARLTNKAQYEVGSFSHFYRGSSAQIQIAIEMLTPSAEPPTKGQIFALISYTDSGDVLRTESTDQGQALQLAGLSAVVDEGIGLNSWTLNGITGVESRRVGLTTAYAVKINTEINVKLYIGGAPTGTRTIYVNPVVSIA